jgi:hypothetical protein
VPQFSSSFDRSAHSPLQSVNPTGQSSWQAPSKQAPVQALAHDPQFARSYRRSVHPVPGQFVWPDGHVPPTQMPPEQYWPPVQALAHDPQCSGLLLTSTHTPSQAAIPPLQRSMQAPAEHR